jgi:hypothetical protein
VKVQGLCYDVGNVDGLRGFGNLTETLLLHDIRCVDATHSVLACLFNS